jgi:MFS transporter, DHA1 family, inner membrane transport protein
MSDSSAGRPREGVLLALLAFGNFIVGMGAFVVVGIVSPMADGLGIAKADAAVVLTTYAFAYALLSPIAATITGQLPRRIVLATALSIFCIGTIISALSPNLLMLAASRIIVALGASMFTPLAAGVAIAVSAPEHRGKALSTVFNGLTLAQVIGTPCGAWLAYHFGWAMAFWAVAALAAAGAAIVFLTVPRDVKFQASGMHAIIDVLKDGRTMFAIAFTATFITALTIVFAFFGPLTEESVGSNPEIRTFFLVLYGVGAVLGNHFGGLLTDRIGGRGTLAILCLAQIAIMPFFSIVPLGPVAFAILVGTWSAFAWSFMAPQQSRLVLIAPQAISVVLALNAAMIYVGIAVGSALASRILGWQGLASLGIAGAIGCVVALLHLLLSGKPAAR